jgi:hypothetical protein
LRLAGGAVRFVPIAKSEIDAGPVRFVRHLRVIALAVLAVLVLGGVVLALAKGSAVVVQLVGM